MNAKLPCRQADVRTWDELTIVCAKSCQKMPFFGCRPPTYLLPSFPAVVNDDVRFKYSAAPVAPGTCGIPDVGSGEASVGEVCISRRSATAQGPREQKAKDYEDRKDG